MVRRILALGVFIATFILLEGLMGDNTLYAGKSSASEASDTINAAENSEARDADVTQEQPPAQAETTGETGEKKDEAPGPSSEDTTAQKDLKPTGEKVSVYIIPVVEQINKPIKFILRRGIKEAIDNGIEAIVLDMNTPGGALDVTLDMMKMLDRFDGITITFINDEAISAGAFIASATDEIYFAHNGVIGAAAPVMATGQEIDESMKQKILSYLKARVRTYTEEHRYRSDVMAAMMDADFELVIDGEVLKPKGELLSLTAREAMKEYGEPPAALLGAGIYDSLDEMLQAKYGSRNYEIREFKVTWSESLAQYLSAISPILMGLGMLCLFIEFKTPGFGVIGIAGICLLLVVFTGNYVAGLAGYEPVLFFFIGILLIAIEIFLFPGAIVFAFSGILLMLGSLVWSTADVWPDEGFSIDPGIFLVPLYEVGFGLLFAIVGLIFVWRFLPKTSVWNKLVLSTSLAPADPVLAGGGSSLDSGSSLPEIGTKGVAVSDLHPSGEVEIDNKRYQASVRLGTVQQGTEVIVTGYKDFRLLVDKDET